MPSGAQQRVCSGDRSGRVASSDCCNIGEAGFYSEGARKNRRTLTAAKRSVALCLQEADQARETFVRHFQSVSTTVMIEHTRMLDSLIQHIRELQQNMCTLDLPE